MTRDDLLTTLQSIGWSDIEFKEAGSGPTEENE